MAAYALEEQGTGELIAEGRTAQVYALSAERVVKVLRPGFPDRLGHAEAAAARLADEAGIGAPRFHGLTRIDGRLGLVYERRDGTSMMDRLATRPWRAGALADTFGTLHAVMHGTSATELPSFRDVITSAVRRVAGLAGRAAHDAAIARVERLADAPMLCHGDFHPGNVMMGAAGPKVIDWLTASCGPPAADVARTLLLLRDGRLPDDLPWVRRQQIGLVRRWFVARYLRAYRRSRPLDPRAVAGWRLPMLVARLDESIETERAHLLRLIAAELRGPSAPRPDRIAE